MCASCFVLMHQLDGTIRRGHGAARTRQEAAHIGRYGARRSCELYGLIYEAVSARGTALRPMLLRVCGSVLYMSAFGVVYGSDRTARTK